MCGDALTLASYGCLLSTLNDIEDLLCALLLLLQVVVMVVVGGGAMKGFVSRAARCAVPHPALLFYKS